MLTKINVQFGIFPKRIVDKHFETPIYRCIHFERLIEILNDKNLVLTKTKTWEDTYENFLYKTKIKVGNYSTSLHSHIDSFYGQCWSMKKETDAIWRIYSPTKKSVIIKTRLSKLAKAGMNEKILGDDPFDTFKIVIAPVKYYSKSKIQKLINEYSANILPDSVQAFNSLFIKRMEFKHEYEVRIIIQKKADHEEDYFDNCERKFIKLPIDPNEFIEEITLDPRMSDEQFKLYAKVFKNAGYIGKIGKSKLYETLK